MVVVMVMMVVMMVMVVLSQDKPRLAPRLLGLLSV
jgi:hypothetical protein